MRLEDYDTSRRFEATVVSSERLNPGSPDEVREIMLEIRNPGFEVAAGQNIGVLAPGQKEFGQKHHFRLYSFADLAEETGGSVRFPICVRRCSYLDEYSGERYQGVASNYLCDRRAGDTLTVTGPYGMAFEVPGDPHASLILIGAGTGIAPFRAFLKHLYRMEPGFQGRVRLFHGGRTGLDLLYMNDQRDDFALYYDKETFEAIKVLTERAHWTDRIDWESALESRSEELWNLLSNEHTRVYLAGLESIRDELDAVFAGLAGSKEQWAGRKAGLEAEGRWIELLY